MGGIVEADINEETVAHLLMEKVDEVEQVKMDIASEEMDLPLIVALVIEGIEVIELWVIDDDEVEHEDVELGDDVLMIDEVMVTLTILHVNEVMRLTMVEVDEVEE